MRGVSLDRADRLEAIMGEQALDALLVSDLVNVRYLSGFTGTSGACVVGPGIRVFVTDFRYVEQAAAQVEEGWERLQGRQELLDEVAERLSGRVGFEDGHVTVRRHGKLEELLGSRAELVPAGDLVERLRAVKDPGEIERIREAARLADAAYEHLCSSGLVGRTEREVALDLEREMRAQGADGPSFPIIVASGPHGALPHASPRDERIQPGTLVVVDLGCLLDGYCSDCTRTFATGPLPAEAKEVYELVLRAQESALVDVRAGADEREVDARARAIIEEAGHGEHFGHGLGHGVGMQVHEGPRLSTSADGRLEEGNVVTVEPGVYVPGSFGVRIEDLVVVGRDGPDVLSRFPKELITLGT
jgi:Xaa-Pro aminopeptidase